MFGLQKWRHVAPTSKRPWDVQDGLLSFGKNANWRLGDAFQHLAVLGQTGSGKTSGSGAAVARAYLHAGFGGLVLCVKPGEWDHWCKLARQCGREADLTRIHTEGGMFLDVLKHEMHRADRGGGETENALKLLKVLMEIGQRGNGQHGSEKFWEDMRDMVLRSAIHLAKLGLGEVTFEALHKICLSAPRGLEQTTSKSFREKSVCLAVLDAVDESGLSESERYEFAATRDCFEGTLPTLGERTRGAVDSTVVSFLDKFNRGNLRSLFASGRSTIAPESMFEGKIFVIDLPVLEYGEVGTIGNAVMKYVCQKAIERRPTSDESRPVFLWADEYQQVAVEYDVEFASCARASRASFVMLFQNLPMLYARFGGEDGRNKAHGLLGNAGSLLFHANMDTVTNQFAADVIGRRLETFHGGGMDLRNADFLSLLTGFGDQSYGQASFNTSYEYHLQPNVFRGLPTGGPRHDLKVGVIFTQGGRRFGADGSPFLRVDFRQ